MKKIFLFSIINLLLLSGCAINNNENKVVSVKVKNNNYTVSDAKQYTSIELSVNNNLSKKIYFEDTTCGNPLKVHQLSAKNEWKLRSNLVSGCTGLGPSEDIPEILKSGKGFNSSKSVSNDGTFKIEFVYYLSETDYNNRLNSQSVYSNQFIISKTSSTKSSVIEACKLDDARKSRLAECLYVAAKNIATKDLNLAIDLCKEIESLGHDFDGCYDGGAIMLQQGNLKDKVDVVCKKYKNADRIKKCIDLATN